MKLLTHNFVGLGVAALAASLAGCSFSCTASASLTGLLLQNVVDAFSHEHRGRYTRRTRLLHSLEGVTALAVVMSALVVGALRFEARESLILLAALELSALSHLVLDALTPDGVYILGRKVNLGRIPYDNPEVNIALQAMGVLALSLAVIASLS
ncbi:MAG: DUF1286 domain-containing protein [Thermoprotei archaeon]|nr:DUF1286 domain-containing protein [Thermoprotei archaeon]